MKKTAFLFLVSAFLFLTSTFSFPLSPSLALAPVDIGDTRHYYPNTTNDDQDYIPSDPNQIETVSIEKFTNISQSFNPIVESPGTSSTPPVYQHQDIDQIKQNIDSRELNTGFFRQNYFHFSQPLKNPLADPDFLISTFTSYNSAHNSTRRSFPAATQRCFISKQVSDISTFIEGGHSICIDRELDTPKGKIRVGEVILALINNGLGKLYYPDPKCPPGQKPEEFPPEVIAALQIPGYTFSLTLPEYQQLYLYGIEPICTNSLAQAVGHCDLNGSGEKVNCRDEIRSEPLAGATANEKLYRSYLPQSVINFTRDYSITEVTPPEIDKPNPLSWLAQFFANLFSGRLSESISFSRPHSIITKIDIRQINGLQAHETIIKNFIPASSNNFDDLVSSGTNTITLDPGESNSELGNIFFELTRPASWKK